MKDSNERTNVAHETQRLRRDVPRTLHTVVAELRARARTSAWTPLVMRAGLVMLALVVLAWIGRAATAAPARGEHGLETPSAVSPIGASAASASSSPIGASASSASSHAEEAPPSPPAETRASRSRATAEEPVYLNDASAEELRRLPGAGPKRAEAIVALRRRLGRFQRIEDLLRVKGIGRATLRKWRPLVRLDTPPKPPVDAGRAEDPGAHLYDSAPFTRVTSAPSPPSLSSIRS